MDFELVWGISVNLGLSAKLVNVINLLVCTFASWVLEVMSYISQAVLDELEGCLLKPIWLEFVILDLSISSTVLYN